jgi:hypothetical protein
MNKPATGHSMHRIKANRKHPPKKLFDYLPKGRRLIMRDPRVSGKYQVILPLPYNLKALMQDPSKLLNLQ